MTTATRRTDDAAATELFCLAESGKKICIGWKESACQASMLTFIDKYTVTLPPGSYIPVGENIVATTEVRSMLLISDRQAWQLADWIQQNIPKPK